MDIFLVLAGCALCVFSCGCAGAVLALALGLSDRNAAPSCTLSDEQIAHNDEVDADEDRDDYIQPEHRWSRWEQVTSKTDGYKTVVVQSRQCKNCGFTEFRKQKIKY